MQDGSRNRRTEAWDDGHREPGLGDRPVREGRRDGEGDLRANLRVTCPVRSYMNSSVRGATGTGRRRGRESRADRIAVKCKEGEGAERGDLKAKGQRMVTRLPFRDSSRSHRPLRKVHPDTPLFVPPCLNLLESDTAFPPSSPLFPSPSVRIHDRSPLQRLAPPPPLRPPLAQVLSPFPPKLRRRSRARARARARARTRSTPDQTRARARTQTRARTRSFPRAVS
jgi:hypothetical protein